MKQILLSVLTLIVINSFAQNKPAFTKEMEGMYASYVDPKTGNVKGQEHNTYVPPPDTLIYINTFSYENAADPATYIEVNDTIKVQVKYRRLKRNSRTYPRTYKVINKQKEQFYLPTEK